MADGQCYETGLRTAAHLSLPSLPVTRPPRVMPTVTRESSSFLRIEASTDVTFPLLVFISDTSTSIFLPRRKSSWEGSPKGSITPQKGVSPTVWKWVPGPCNLTLSFPQVDQCTYGRAASLTTEPHLACQLSTSLATHLIFNTSIAFINAYSSHLLCAPGDKGCPPTQRRPHRPQTQLTKHTSTQLTKHRRFAWRRGEWPSYSLVDFFIDTMHHKRQP